MGREVKRVPRDFDAPLRQVWAGYQAREWTEPPTGDGYQLWETVSEGSPISPVFPTARDLAVWMSEHHCTVTGPVPVEMALRFIEVGWAPTGAEVGGRYVSGVAWAAGEGQPDV